MSGTMSPAGGGITPSPAFQSPQAQSILQRYSGMPTAQLQELAVRMSGSPQGQMLSQILAQRNIVGSDNTSLPAGSPIGGIAAAQASRPVQTQNSQPSGTGIAPTQQSLSAGVGLPPTTNAMNRGGIARAHYDMGGETSTPWWIKNDARNEASPGTGMIHSFTPGRTDTINMEPLAGSYVIPADVISGLGEGNSLAGAAAMDRVVKGPGPYTAAMPQGHHGSGPPQPPRIARTESTGGKQPGAPGQTVPIIAAGGEYMVSPDDVRRLGKGDIKRGHDLLDEFVLHVRARTVKQLRKLPPPKKK